MENRNKIIQKVKKWLSLMLIIVVILGLAACKSRELSTNTTAYYIVYSGTSNNKSRIEGIDINGNPTVIHDIDAVNISRGTLVGEEFIAGGHRANNHLIMQQDGSFEEFYLLDNPQYSGVWNITLDGENIVSVMNGNVDDEKNVYLNLLVIQDRSQKVLVKKEIDITPNTLLIDGNYLYMGGCFWQYDVSPVYCGASIARYNMETGEYEEKHFHYNVDKITATDYKYLTKHGEYFYAIFNESLMNKDSTDRQNTVDIINSETLELVDTLVFNERISWICFVGDDLYIVIADKLCKYDVETNAVEEIYIFPENTNIESSHMRDGHIYYNTRYLPVQKDGKMWNVGYIIDFNITNNSVKQTPLITDAKNTESIVFFPLGVTDN